MFQFKFYLLTFQHSHVKIFNCFTRYASVYTTSLLEELFGIDAKRYSILRNKHKIPKLSVQHLRQNGRMREKLGISKQDWLKYPRLLLLSDTILEQRYLNLHEGGIQNITAEHLFFYRKFVNKSGEFLKGAGFIKKDDNVAENFISHFVPRPQIDIGDLSDEMRFETIRYTLLKRCLIWRLDLPQEEIEKFFRINHQKYKSFNHISRNITISENIGFKHHKLLKYGCVLMANPDSIEKTIEKFKDKFDICRAFFKTASLISVRFKNFVEIYEALREAKITDETISQYMEIFLVNPNTLKLHLSEIKRIPQLNIYINDSRILKLIRKHNNIRSHLALLQELQYNCTPYHAIVKSGNEIRKHITKNNDVNNYREIYFLFKKMFGTVRKKTYERLKKNPLCFKVPLEEMYYTYKCLKTNGYSNDDIEECVDILLYKQSDIKLFLELVVNLEVNGYKPNNCQKLNLFLYIKWKPDNSV